MPCNSARSYRRMRNTGVVDFSRPSLFTGRAMIVGRTAKHLTAATVALLMLLSDAASRCAGAAAPKQQSLDEWRSLTASNAPPPRVFVKGDQIRFYFQTATNVEEFSARWDRHRIPSDGYRVSSGLLRWDQKLPRMPEGERGWREATVIAGAEWGRLTTNLVEALTPGRPGTASTTRDFWPTACCIATRRALARDASIGEQPKEVVIDRHLSIEETLATLARQVEQDLVRKHPGDSLFLLLAPNARRFPQPLLLDRQQRQCIWLSPAALYDNTERGLGLSTTAQGLSALLLEGHGLALLKNPISSVARLGDLGVETVVRFVRLPVPQTHHPLSPADPLPGHGPRAVGGLDGSLHRHAAGGRFARPAD